MQQSQKHAALQGERQRVQHGKAGEAVGHHQRGGRDLREHRDEPADEAEGQRDQSATSVIGGNSALFSSGQARCSRPDVAVILAASQRLSVSVIMATIVAAAGAMMASAATQRSISPDDAASRGPEDSQQAAAQRTGDGLGVGAERQQGGNRGQRGKARDPEQDAADRIPFELQERPARHHCLRPDRHAAVPTARDGQATRPAARR